MRQDVYLVRYGVNLGGVSMASEETKRVLNLVREAIATHKGDWRELYEELIAEAEGWEMALQEEEKPKDDN